MRNGNRGPPRRAGAAPSGGSYCRKMPQACTSWVARGAEQTAPDRAGGAGRQRQTVPRPTRGSSGARVVSRVRRRRPRARSGRRRVRHVPKGVSKTSAVFTMARCSMDIRMATSHSAIVRELARWSLLSTLIAQCSPVALSKPNTACAEKRERKVNTHPLAARVATKRPAREVKTRATHQSPSHAASSAAAG